MTTLAELTRRTSRLINRHASGAATSSPGNATTLPDTVGLAGYPDDQFNGGTIWVTSGANAGLSRAVTDFANTGDTLTFAAFPSNIVSGVTYEVTDGALITYQDLRQAVNLALQEIGKIHDSPDETLTTVVNQLTYTLPAGVSDIELVYVVTDIGETTEWEYLSTHWKERLGELVFDKNYEPDADKTLRIYYRIFHADLDADADTLDSQVDDQYLIYLAARQAMRLSYKRFGKAGADSIPEWLNEAAEEAMKHVRRNMNAPIIRVHTA